MTSGPTADQRRQATRPRAKRRRGQWIPPQHGAWAMLLVPYLAAILTTGFAWPDLPLLVAWLGGYLLSYFALLAVKTRRLTRVRTQVVGYGVVTAAAGLVVLVARPGLLAFAPVFALVLAINGWFAARRNDRALVNGLVSVAAATLIMPVVAVVAGVSPWQVTTAATVTLLYFVGSVLFVKTCIRERDNPVLYAVSVGFHAVALAVAAWLSLIFVLPFVWYLIRAATFPRAVVSAKQIGIVEIGSSVLLLVAVAIAA